jgi:ATP-dependent Clp protease adaptor protein ClpS
VTTLTPPKERTRPAGPDSGLGDAWKVIVLNDNHNTFEGVAFAFASVLPDTSYEKGFELASQVHYRGLAVVWSGHKERAELYHEQLVSYGLTLAPLEC